MAYFQLSKLHFADLLNRESRKTQQKILDVSSKPGISWKIVRFLEVRELVSLFAHIVIIRGANKRPAVLKSKYIFFKSLLVVGSGKRFHLYFSNSLIIHKVNYKSLLVYITCVCLDTQ